MEGENKLQAGWMLLKKTASECWNDNTFRLAASLDFYTIFSVAPILLIAAARGANSTGGARPVGQEGVG